MILVYLQDLPQFTPANWQSCQTLGRFLLRKVMTKSFYSFGPWISFISFNFEASWKENKYVFTVLSLLMQIKFHELAREHSP